MSYTEPPRTDNHELPLVPPIGETNAEDYEDDWGHILNDYGWSYIEEQLVVRDTDANKANYTAYQDAIYWATDGDAQFYVGDGSTWQPASASFDELIASSITATHSMIVERGISGTETLSIQDGESMVVSGEYEVADSAEITVSGSGEFTVV